MVSYQLGLGWRTRRDPTSSAQDVMLTAREAWVESVMRERRDILAVQTLRNSTMSASFMASTAILLVAFFAFSMSVCLLHHIGHSINVPLDRAPRSDVDLMD